MRRSIPKLISEFEGDVFAIVEFLVEFSFEFLVDPLVLLAGGQHGRESGQGESCQKSQLSWPKELEERPEH